VVRWFEVVEERREQFEEIFQCGGLWEEFLRLSPGYLKSELYPVSGNRARYQVFDYWGSHEHFEDCRRLRQQAIENFGLLYLNKDLVLTHAVLGSFYEEGPDESGLVLR